MARTAALSFSGFAVLCFCCNAYSLSFGSLGKSYLSSEDYLQKRANIIKQDALQRTGQNIVLNAKELLANDVILKVKRKELDSALESEYSLPGHMFTTVKSKIENSDVFKILKKMPKGALLHTHDLSMATYDWLVKNVTYRDSCFMCYNFTSKITMFKLANQLPNTTDECAWSPCMLERHMSGNPIKFDAEMYQNWTFMDQDIEVLYPTQVKIWNKFSAIFTSVGGLLSNLDVFKEYYVRALEELVEDNVQYVEIRALLIPLYDLDGKIYSSPEVALKIYQAATADFAMKHALDFHGAKIIYICLRLADKATIKECIYNAMGLQEKYEEMFAGFDLVGQEDPGHPLLYFLDELLLPSNVARGLQYFFHAGETDWEGRHVDNNLVDAYLLNTSRVGHGFALTKHPELMQLYRARNISAEVCPVSNQVLGLISDLRQHPAAVFLSQNFPMTVSNDDPAIWGCKGVTYDWFELFMGMTRADDGLRLLKQLAVDSIRETFEASWERNPRCYQLLWYEQILYGILGSDRLITLISYAHEIGDALAADIYFKTSLSPRPEDACYVQD